MSAPSVTTNAAELPPGYRLHSTIDLKEDKRAATAIQMTFIVTAAALIGVAILLDLPLASDWASGVIIAVTLAACVTYSALHELTHGVLLGLLTGVRPTYAVRLPYLVTGCSAYLRKQSAIVVAVAPAVIWGVVLVVAMFTVPADALLTAYVVLTLNFAGSAGDFFQAWKISQLPRTALVRDAGKQTSVFLPES